MYHNSAPNETVSFQTTKKIKQSGAAPLPEESGTPGDATYHLKFARPSLTNNENLVNATNLKKLNIPTRFVKHSKSSTQPLITKFLTKTPSATDKDLLTEPSQFKGRSQQADQPFPLPLEDSYPFGSKSCGSNDDWGSQDRKPTKGHCYFFDHQN
jgi:hypothetical protein